MRLTQLNAKEAASRGRQVAASECLAGKTVKNEAALAVNSTGSMSVFRNSLGLMKLLWLVFHWDDFPVHAQNETSKTKCGERVTATGIEYFLILSDVKIISVVVKWINLTCRIIRREWVVIEQVKPRHKVKDK
jgi:hypothetical protein